MKICSNCTYFSTNRLPPRCKHPTALIPVDIVTSNKNYEAAWRMRKNNGPCGPTARNFKPKGLLTCLFDLILGNT